jgi:hypothetical protein
LWAAAGLFPAPGLTVQPLEPRYDIVRDVLLDGFLNRLTQLDTALERFREATFAAFGRDTQYFHHSARNFRAESTGVYRLWNIAGDFRDLPLSGALATLSNMQVLAACYELIVIQHCCQRVTGLGIVEHAYAPVFLPTSYHVFPGERFAADILLGRDFRADVELLSIQVNGQALPLWPYPFRYEVKPKKPGKHILEVDITAFAIQRRYDGYYRDTIHARRRYAYYVAEFHPRIEFHRRPFPERYVFLAGRYSGAISQAELSAEVRLQTGFDADDLETEPTCPIASFQLTRFRPHEDWQEAQNSGASFGPEVRRLLEDTQPGDRLLFDDIRVQCPGEATTRDVRELSLWVED